MNGLRLRPVDAWRSCLGMCTICGCPMGLEKGRDVTRERADDATEEEIMQALLVDDDHLSAPGMQENAVRVALFRYGLLGKYEDCHVIDRYTCLKSRSTAEGARFMSVVKEHPSVSRLLGPEFFSDICSGGRDQQQQPAKAPYEECVEMCMRLVERTTVPGCSLCNSAMNRAILHADITYRCFPLKADVATPDLQGSSQKAISLKKIIQQAAFFFRYETTETGRRQWSLKPDIDIMLDAALYRCAANLCAWGKSGAPRFRMIAVFYGAWYIYHTKRLKDTISPFIQWHMHVFRDYYLCQFHKGGGGTWFGMSLVDAGNTFDATRDDSATSWLAVVSERLEACADGACAFMYGHTDFNAIAKFQAAVRSNVSNELTLFLFCCHHLNTMEAIEIMLAYFIFNAQDPMCLLLRRRLTACIKEIRQVVSKHKLLAAPQQLREPAKAKRLPSTAAGRLRRAAASAPADDDDAAGAEEALRDLSLVTTSR